MKFQPVALVLSLLLSTPVAFSGTMREEDHLISNGQGVSSPSFWDGLSGENPAGLTYNSSLKLQAGSATFDDSLNNLRHSGAVLVGNGLLGAGLEYSTYNSGPYSSGSAQINWGIGGFFRSLSTSIGVSGHHLSGSSGGTYDIGALIELSHRLRVGILVPNFTNGLRVVAGGLTYELDRSIDLVVDGAVDVQRQNGTIKPGFSVHSDRFQLSAAYGLHLMGDSDVFLSRELSAGLGVKIANSILIGYEYKGLPEHRLGLTLKLN